MTKQEKIQKMIAMQKQFMDKERAGGVSPEEYFTPKEGTVLDSFREEYSKLASQLIDEAHEEVGSKR